MNFHSTLFVGFFVAVYALYLACFRLPQGLRDRIPPHRVQNLLLLVASYVFYGAWDWRFLSLIWLSTAIDFAVGIGLSRSDDPRVRKRLVAVSMLSNLGILGFFKYFGFFVSSATELLGALGLGLETRTLSIVLPVGISFYTFQSMSYAIDVYRGEMPATRNPFDFALYVAFFPQLVAGPIERGKWLLPQFQQPRTVTGQDVQTGLLWIAFGYVLKVGMADTLAPLVDHVFERPESVDGTAALAGIVGFTVQIYCDFAGYSLIARGLARTMGIVLMQNFRMPFLAESPREFWRHWHISLSTWLRDYLYVPLGGNRGGPLLTYRNLAITMLLGGLWHGAAWNFVIWGAYHGGLLAATRAREERFGPARLPYALRVAGMFAVTVFGFFVFRVDSLEQFRAVSGRVAQGLTWSLTSPAYVVPVLTCLALAVGYQVAQERLGGDPEADRLSPPVRAAIFAFAISTVLVVGFRPTPFVYFQF